MMTLTPKLSLGFVIVESWPSFRRLTPARVPIHKLPSRAPSKKVIFPGKGLSFGGCHGTNWMPSKRMRWSLAARTKLDPKTPPVPPLTPTPTPWRFVMVSKSHRGRSLCNYLVWRWEGCSLWTIQCTDVIVACMAPRPAPTPYDWKRVPDCIHEQGNRHYFRHLFIQEITAYAPKRHAALSACVETVTCRLTS
jgi:hypothetical protein